MSSCWAWSVVWVFGVRLFGACDARRAPWVYGVTFRDHLTASSSELKRHRCASCDDGTGGRGTCWYHEKDVLQLAKFHPNVVAATGFVLPAVVVAFVEFLLTGGSTGLMPIMAALIAGVPLLSLMYFMGAFSDREEPPSQDKVGLGDQVVQADHVGQVAQVVQGDQVGQIVQGDQVVQVVEGDQGVQDDRFFTPRTVKELKGEVEGKTELAAEDASRRHVGHWMRVSGQVTDVTGDFGDVMMTVETNEDDLVFCQFDEKVWRGRLVGFNEGDTVKVAGQIERISRFGVGLVACELE